MRLFGKTVFATCEPDGSFPSSADPEALLPSGAPPKPVFDVVTMLCAPMGRSAGTLLGKDDFDSTTDMTPFVDMAAASTIVEGNGPGPRRLKNVDTVSNDNDDDNNIEATNDGSENSSNSDDDESKSAPLLGVDDDLSLSSEEDDKLSERMKGPVSSDEVDDVDL